MIRKIMLDDENENDNDHTYDTANANDKVHGLSEF